MLFKKIEDEETKQRPDQFFTYDYHRCRADLDVRVTHSGAGSTQRRLGHGPQERGHRDGRGRGCQTEIKVIANKVFAYLW